MTLSPFVHPSSPSCVPDPSRVAAVLASFGSTVETARAAEANLAREAEKRFHGTRVVLANTARTVMAENARQGVVIPSLYRVLADLADEGYTHVAVQSLHIIPGAEFEGVAAVAAAQAGLPKGLARVSVGAPLLASNNDCKRAVKALVDSLPDERAPGEPVIFVGHGARHGVGGMIYPALQWHMARHDAACFISTLEGLPSHGETVAALGTPRDGATVWLAPLLGLAGDHAVNDLYGEQGDSCQSVLAAAGWRVKQSFVPLYTIPAIRAIWFDHLDAALAALGARSGN